MIFKNKKFGFSLIELTLAIAVFGILAASTFYIIGGSFRSYYGAGDKYVLTTYAQEGIEGSKAIADYSWTTFRNAVGSNHGLVKSSGLWTYSGTSDTLGAFTRVIAVTDVQRDGNGNIVSSGGNNDPLTKKVTVTVSASGIQNYVLSEYVTDEGYKTWEQTDWSATSAETYWHDLTLTSNPSTAVSATISNFTTSTAGELILSGASAAALTSSIYNMGSAAKELRAVTVSQSPISGTCTLQITVETSESTAFTSVASQVISDTSTTTYSSTTSDSLNGKLYMRYKVDMSGCTTASTTLHSIKIKYR